MKPATVAEQTEPENTLSAGDLVDGKYRVEYLLGRGGMAAVWAGTNERTGKRVALKVLLPYLTTSPGVGSLFRREGFAASRIDHPNVVTVFDLVEHRGLLCIVMELLTGEPLDSLVARNGALTVHEACSLLLPAMRGVSAAHAEGVIHRDLKPQNIFICKGPDGRTVTTKVLDFGISLMLGQAREPAGSQAPSIPMGTPAYMAPEQIWGGAPIDERTDVYGFGILLYETLTGRLPFTGEPGPALFNQILDDPIPSLAQARPDLPPGMVRIVETALAKAPADRHPTLDAMIAIIEDEIALLAPQPHALTPASGSMIEAPPRSPTGRRGAAVEAALHGKPSTRHRATKRLVNFPIKATEHLRWGWLSWERAQVTRVLSKYPAGVVETLTHVGRRLRERRWLVLGSAGFAGLVAGILLVRATLIARGAREPADLPPAGLQSGIGLEAKPAEAAGTIVPASNPVLWVKSELPVAPATAMTREVSAERTSVTARAWQTPAALADVKHRTRPRPARASAAPANKMKATRSSGRKKPTGSDVPRRAGRLTVEDF